MSAAPKGRWGGHGNNASSLRTKDDGVYDEIRQPWQASPTNPRSPLHVWHQAQEPQAEDLPAEAAQTAMHILFPPVVAFNPVKWAERRGLFLWSKQREFLRSVMEHRYTAVQSCHDAGKSFGVAVLILAWADTYGHNSFVAWTAPTYPQVNAIVGRELRDLIRKLQLDDLELMLDNTLKYRGVMRGYGRKPADKSQSAFQGTHAKHVLVVIDEACGISENIFTGADAIATNEEARVIAIGNPDNPSSHFKKICEPGSGWNKIRIDGLETPNFTDEEVPDWLRPLLLSPDWVEERKVRWGQDSPLFISKVRGEFPQHNINSVFPWDLITQAGSGKAIKTAAHARPSLVVDIARSGQDEAAGYAISNGKARLVFSYDTCDLMELTGACASWGRDNPNCSIIIDANGMGAGVHDRLREQGFKVRGFLGGARARDNTRYANARAEAAFDLQEAFRSDALKFDGNVEALLASELVSVTWEFNSKGLIKLTSKEDMAKNGIASPNRADCLMMYAWMNRLGKVRGRSGNRDLSQVVSAPGGGDYGR